MKGQEFKTKIDARLKQAGQTPFGRAVVPLLLQSPQLLPQAVPGPRERGGGDAALAIDASSLNVNNNNNLENVVVPAKATGSFLAPHVETAVRTTMGALTESLGENGEARRMAGNVASMVKDELREGGALYAMSQRMSEVMGAELNTQVTALMDKQLPHLREVLNEQMIEILDTQLPHLREKMSEEFRTFVRQFRREQLAQGGELNLASQEAADLFEQRAQKVGGTIAAQIKEVGGNANNQLEKATAQLGTTIARSEQFMEKANERLTQQIERSEQFMEKANTRLTDQFERSQKTFDAVADRSERLMENAGNNVTRQLENATKTFDKVADRTERVINVVDNKLQKILLYGAGGILITAAGYYTIKLLYNHWERTLAKPKLVISSTLNQGIWAGIKSYFKTPVKPKELVFAPDVAKSLTNIIATTKSINDKIARATAEGKISNVKYRNLLLWGKPGGGKTAFAEKLAAECGMDVVVISGAAFAQYKDGEGITEMNKIFEDIHANRKGVLVFMDEADSFTGGRNDRGATAKTSYQLVNNWLHHTGGRSAKVMFVYATNRPDAFDNAFARRIDDSIEVPLPGAPERAGILRLYRDTLMFDVQNNSPEFIESVKQTLDEAFLFEAALQTDGLSGGELEGIINTMISDASVADFGLVTRAIADDVIRRAVEKNRSFNQGFKADKGAKDQKSDKRDQQKSEQGDVQGQLAAT